MAQSKLERIMSECGVLRDPKVHFGRPCVDGVPVVGIVDRIRGGESMRAIAYDYDLTRRQIDGAIRFALIYPRADLPSFWRRIDGGGK